MLKLHYLRKNYNFKIELAFFIKNTKKQPLFSKWLVENTKSSFKDNARIFSKNSTTDENIRILRLEEDYKTYKKKKLQTRN